MNDSKKIEVGKIINEGQRFFATGRYREAAEKCSEAIAFLDREADSKNDPESDAIRLRMYVARGSSYASFDRSQEAIEDYNTVIALLDGRDLNEKERVFLIGVHRALEELYTTMNNDDRSIEN